MLGRVSDSRPPADRLVAALRGGWGLALLAVPGPLVGAAAGGSGGRGSDSRARVFARLLGARQLAEAALLRRAGRRAVAAGAAIDAIHAATVAALAAADRRRRRPAAANAAVALGFALEGALRARRAGG